MEHNLYKKTLQSSFSWGVIITIITFLKQIILAPFFLTFFGKEFFALWIIYNSISYVISALNLGVINYSHNILSLAYFKNQKLTESSRNSIIVSNLFIFLIQLFLSLIISKPYFNELITSLETNSLSIFILIFSRIFNQQIVTFYLRLLDTVGLVRERLKIEAARELAEILIVFVFSVMFKNFDAIFYGILIYNLLQVLLIFVHKKQINPIINNFTIKNFDLSILLKSTSMFFSNLFEKFFDQGILLVLSKLISPLSVTNFTTTRVISNSLLRVSTIFTEPLIPGMQKSFVSNNPTNLSKFFKFYWLLTSIPILIGFSISLPFIGFLYSYWVQQKLTFSPDLYFLLFLCSFILNFSMIIIQYLKRTNKTKILNTAYISKSLCFIIFLLIITGDYTLTNIAKTLLFCELVSAVILVYFIFLEIRQEFKGVRNLLFCTIFIVSIIYFFGYYLNNILLTTTIILISTIILIIYEKNFLLSFKSDKT
jgi:O-antigen/teichoic acid export membrane protein